MCVSHAGLSKTQLPLYNEKDATPSKIYEKNSVFKENASNIFWLIVAKTMSLSKLQQREICPIFTIQ